jgi:hypothetical protein
MKSTVYVTIKLGFRHEEPKTVTELTKCVNEMDYGFISTIDGIEVDDMEMTEQTLLSFNTKEE